MSQIIDPSQLGLGPEEVSLLRQQGATHAGSSSSRAASRASSSQLLHVDSSSLAALGRHFDALMVDIQRRLDYLFEQSQIVTMHMTDQTGAMIDNADAEIARYHGIMAQIDELELDFDRIGSIREIVRGFRQRAEAMERELERSQPSSSRSHHHSSSSHRHHGHSSSSRRHRH